MPAHAFGQRGRRGQVAAGDHVVRRVDARDALLVDATGVKCGEVTPSPWPPEMAPEGNGDDAPQIQIEAFEQCRDPLACPRVLVEGPLRFDVDEARMALPQALGQEGRVPAPRAVESLPHLRNPATAELRVRLGHDEGVAERRLRRSPLLWHDV